MAYYPPAVGGWQPPQMNMMPQANNYPPLNQAPPQPQQNGQGWYYPPPPPQESETDLLRQILQKLDEIQKGVTKRVPDAE